MDARVFLLLPCMVLWVAVNVHGVVDTEVLSATVTSLARQLMNQELAAQEKVRSDGDSGLKLVRLRNKGTKSYHSETYTGNSVAAMHDHANNDRTVGMGETIAVLNGVEFRTRHNDFRLRMPSTTSSDWNTAENIPYPEVPPEVLAKATPEEQIAEMQKWFEAWQNQDSTTRDYKPYFKPVLCYLEGTWTTNVETLDEPFFSDRHQLDAKNWFDLLEKIRFTSYTGKKDKLENFAYLPTTLMNIVDGLPEYAQWNYRILCHPLKEDLPLNRLQVADDLASRKRNNRPFAEHIYSRAAHFQLAAQDEEFSDKAYKYGLLDKLMGEIPGKDNYGAYIEDHSLDLDAVQFHDVSKLLNVGYYHRIMRTLEKGAMGEDIIHRGFSDRNVFVAYTQQPQVSEMRLQTCKKVSGTEQCREDKARLSYAIPLEIIYLTPLYTWNPYNIVHKGDSKSTEAKTVTAGGRNGGLTAETAYDGTHSRAFYRTPIEFLSGSVDADSADTSRDKVGVLDPSGVVRQVTASGTRIILPNVPGIGPVRIRYSIAPLHEDGNSIKKELDALKDIVIELAQNRYMMRDPPASLQYTQQTNAEILLVTDENSDTPYGTHFHYVLLTSNDMMNLFKGNSIRKFTSTVNNHNHDMKILLKSYKNFRVDQCDGGGRCWHNHGTLLTKVE